MPGDEQGTSGVGPDLFQEFIGHLRATTERLRQLGQSGEHFRLRPDALPLPGALSAAQVRSIADGITAQRQSIAALKAQLSSFDEQLAVLEQTLAPFADWSRSWADLEQRLLNIKSEPAD